MQGIEIPIGAPLGQLDKDLKGANAKLKAFASEASKTSAVLGGSVAKGADQAGFALTNLGRVAQDAPFGFIGIQNNLNPLLESFGRLKQETGSTGGALKALGQSLIGPAGLGFALSVVSAGILIYQQYQQRANKETQNAKKNAEDYVAGLTQLNQVQLKGAQNAQDELVALKSLYTIYQDATIPLSKRKDAYKEIQDLYPAYFGNLDFEEKATNKTKDAYDALTISILETARARAAQDLIVKNQTKRLELEDKLIKAEDERVKLLNKKNSLINQSTELVRTSTREGAGISQLVQANSVQGSINDNLSNQKDLKTQINQIDRDNLRLTESITSSVKKGADLTSDDKVKKVKQTKQEFNRDPEFKAKSSLNELDLFLEAYRKTEATLNKTPLVPFPGLKEKLAEVNLLLVEFNKGASEIIQNSITNTFGQLGTAIGEALATGGNVLKSIGQTILQGLSGFLSEMGGLLIKYGTLAVLKGKLDLAILTGGPVAIGAGLAAIGAGIALKAAGSAIGSLANNKKDVSLPNQSNAISTSASSSFQDFGGGRVVFEISGTNLIGVLNRAGAKLQRYGG